jgi:hypothetical protein
VSSHYVTLHENGKKIFIKKSTLCWILTKSKERISTDRLQRFISSMKVKLSNPQNDCSVNCDIFIGDWCVFNNLEEIVIGQIIGFQYINEKGKHKKYTWNVCPTKPPPDCTNPKGINVFANWFLFNCNTHLLSLKGSYFFLNIDCYFSHISPPEFIDGNLNLTNNSFDYVKDLVGETVDPLLN